MSFNPLGHNTPDRDRKVVVSLVKRLRKLTHPRIPTIIEVGCWAGQTTIDMVDCGAIVHCIDHWESSDEDPLHEIAQRYTPDALFREFCINMGDRLFRYVHPHRGSSELMAELWPFKVDMVYLDADHRYESVLKDIKMWTKHVDKGRLIAGHDYGDQFPGVIQAVKETGGCELQSEWRGDACYATSTVWWRWI